MLMLFQMRYIARVTLLAVNFRPITGLWHHSTSFDRHFFLLINLLVRHEIFCVRNSAIKTCIPIQRNKIMTGVQRNQFGRFFRRSFRLKSNFWVYRSQTVHDLTIVFSVILFFYVGYPQSASVNVFIVSVCSNDIMTFRRGMERWNIMFVKPFEFWFGVGLDLACHFRWFSNVICDFVVLVQYDWFVWKEVFGKFSR